MAGPERQRFAQRPFLFIIKAWCGAAPSVRLKGLAVVPSPSLALPHLPPRPDVYARQHSLTRRAVCLCVRRVARPFLCVCVGRKRRCSQALSTCSPFLPRSVPLARSCPRAPRLRSINPSSPLPPPDRPYAHPLSFCKRAARDSVLVSPSSCHPPPSPPPVCARRAPTTLVFSTLSPSLASPRVLSYVTLLAPRTPPSVNGTASHAIRAHDLLLTKRLPCQLS